MTLLDALISLFPQPATDLSSIYSDPICACTIYALLDHTAQQVIDSILFIDGPIPFAHIRTLHPPQDRPVWNRALLLLKQLGLLQGRGQELWINAQYQRALIRGIAHNSRPAGVSSTQPAQGDNSQAEYESLIYSITTGAKRVDKELQGLFTSAGLLRGTEVTQAGFQFLVQPVNTQLWIILSEWLIKNLSVDNVRLLLCLPRMLDTLLYPGRPAIFQHMKLLDAVNRPTLLHRNLLRQRHPSPDSLQIIVETNYHLYAYSPTPLALATLSLFSAPKDRLPNLLRARLTQDSCRSAYKRGITAEQLVVYLQSHSPLPLPPTLTDQLRLWEADLRRVRSSEGYMYAQFSQQAEFETAVRLAGSGNVLYCNPGSRVLIVNEQGHAILGSKRDYN